MALLPLLERPPWERHGRGGRLERYSGGTWAPVASTDRARVPQQEAQVWLMLNNLLVDPAARAKLDLTTARCEVLFKLKERFSELLFDQVRHIRANRVTEPAGRTGTVSASASFFCESSIRPSLQLPVLRDLQRVIDELALGINMAVEPRTSKLVVEQVPQLRARMLARSSAEWEAVAEAARRRQFGGAAAALSRQRLKAMLRSFDFLADMEGSSKKGTSDSGGSLSASVKVDAYRRVKEGVWEWWSTYSLDINDACPPEHVSNGSGSSVAFNSDENRPSQPGSVTSEGSSASIITKSSTTPVTGLRYRLRPLAEGLHRALPCDGKLSVLYGGHVCEALLSLPAAETREGLGMLPPAVWVTVGGLASPGLALQLKLKRMVRPSERDKVSGAWHAYVPMGGGLAVRNGLLDERSAE